MSSSGAGYARLITPSFTGVVTITPSGAAVKGLIVKGFASQSANLFEAQNSAAVVATAISPTGRILSQQRMSIGWATSGPVVDAHNNFGNDSTADRVVMLVRGAASQTANLFEAQDSTAAVLAGFKASGKQIVIAANTATTVGAAGAASALPLTPTGYEIFDIGGTNFKRPYYAN